MGIRATGEGRDLSCLSGKFTVYKRYPEQSQGSQPLEVTPLGLHQCWINPAVLYLWVTLVSFWHHGFYNIFWCFGQEADNRTGPLRHHCQGTRESCGRRPGDRRIGTTRPFAGARFSLKLHWPWPMPLPQQTQKESRSGVKYRMSDGWVPWGHLPESGPTIRQKGRLLTSQWPESHSE